MDIKWIAALLALCLMGMLLFAVIPQQKPSMEQNPLTHTSQPISMPTSTVVQQPSSSIPTETQPASGVQEQENDVLEAVLLTYEAYMELTPEEQQKYFLSFPSYMEYVAWFEAAKATYEESLDRITLEGDGMLDIGEIIEGMN